jgi:DNA-binding NarL/FixJ family response regulator
MNNRKPLRIIIIDDHPLVLEGFTQLFRSLPYVELVTKCSDYLEFAEKMKRQDYDIAFLDLHMPQKDGFAICEEIKANYNGVFVAILSTYEERQFVEKAYSLGACAYFFKSVDSEIIGKFLLDFWQGNVGEFFVHIPQMRKPQEPPFPKKPFHRYELLTNRERHIMEMLVKGMGHKDIEFKANISYETYKTHHSNILKKLEVKNDVELTRLVMENGWVQ